ncbi:MAG: hypothetical protein LBD02_09255 [Christensenellaceae bacterium]|nr:hypothetical protein [Christensenellaceae bacterium]
MSYERRGLSRAATTIIATIITAAATLGAAYIAIIPQVRKETTVSVLGQAAETLKIETQTAYNNGYAKGSDNAKDPARLSEAYQEGYSAGVPDGEASGKAAGHSLGLVEGQAKGESIGYERGVNDAWAAGRAPLPVDIPAAPAFSTGGPSATPPTPSDGTPLFDPKVIPLVNSENWPLDEGAKKDSVGNTYTPEHYVITNDYTWTSDYKRSYAEFNIRQAYTKLVGKVAVHQESPDRDAVFIIYADDEEIYNHTFKRSDYPLDLELTIPKGTKILRLWEQSGGSLLLMDFMLYP